MENPEITEQNDTKHEPDAADVSQEPTTEPSVSNQPPTDIPEPSPVPPSEVSPPILEKSTESKQALPQNQEGKRLSIQDPEQSTSKRSSLSKRISSAYKVPLETPQASLGAISEGRRRTSVRLSADIKRARSGSIRKSKALGSKAKLVLGSILDIKSTAVEGLDRKGPRYQNTYRLQSNNPFNSEKVEKILREIMQEAMEGLQYDSETCPTRAKWASGQIRTRIKELEFDRYKLVCVVSIGEKNSQDVYVTCKFLWDPQKDRFATYSIENTYVYGIAYCFGLYYE